MKLDVSLGGFHGEIGSGFSKLQCHRSILLFFGCRSWFVNTDGIFKVNFKVKAFVADSQ